MDLSLDEESLEENDTANMTKEELTDFIHDSIFQYGSQISKKTFEILQSVPLGHLQNLAKICPHDFKICKLALKSHYLALATSQSEPSLQIVVNGKENVGRCFHGDVVCVKIISRQSCPQNGEELTGKVIGVISRDEACCQFICKMEGGNQQLVNPINSHMTKICITQRKPGKIDVRRLCNQRWIPKELIEISEDQLLAVRVLKWEKKHRYPLGVVTKVFAANTDIAEMLDFEFNIKDHPPAFNALPSKHNEVKIEASQNCKTFTIDSPSAQDLDDAISVKDMDEDTYQIAIHITDVASYINKDSEEDIFAKEQGETIYRPEKEPAYLFSRKLSSESLSLLPKKNRRSISLKTIIDKKTNTIRSNSFALSTVRSEKRMSYEEADLIIQMYCLDSSRPLNFSSVDDCLIMLYKFSEEHRRCRLDGGCPPGWQVKESISHAVVEELMIYYNSAVADLLISADITRDLTPLRCQRPPDQKHLQQFKQRYSSLIPLSMHLSHIVSEVADSELEQDQYSTESEDSATTESEEYEKDDLPQADERQRNDYDEIPHLGLFTVITSVLEKMEESTRCQDYNSLVKMVSSDDIHPTLRFMFKEFQEHQNKAEILSSCSSPASRMGHYGLQLNSYTFATSPMRRYLDLILQRLLHSVLSEKVMNNADYTQMEINQVCDAGMEVHDRVTDYNTKVLNLTAGSQHSSKTKHAVVEDLQLQGHDFKISFLLDPNLPGLSLLYRHLKVMEQPEYNPANGSVTLRWKRRVYSFTKSHINLTQTRLNKDVTEFSVDIWSQMLLAVKNKNWDKIKQCLQDMRAYEMEDSHRQATQTGTCPDQQHYTEQTMELRVGKVLKVQLSSGCNQGQICPEVQLFNVNSQFEVCLEHARNPTECFSKEVDHASKREYENCTEYQNIWCQICQMDTASNAVEENNSIILEDVILKWTNENQGSFQITETQKKQWALAFDPRNCFLCIRLRNQEREKPLSPSPLSSPVLLKDRGEADKQSFLNLLDPSSFTWVAHGVTRPNKAKKKKEEEENEKSSKILINFDITHMSMSHIPATVFDERTRFTVEVIPKKIPYMLHELAVANLKHANTLVKNIATGKIRQKNSLEDDSDRSQSTDLDVLGLPPLNESQERAVDEALKNDFTIIQGPPGTGKTVVGVHIVYQYFKNNSKMAASSSRECKRTTENGSHGKGKPKKCGILYCGPSNKAVDIVAAQLLKQKDLKPLRIYSDQLEMREFPYPGSDLKLCRKSLREEKLREELRSITLMYLIRQSGNPFSERINALEKDMKSGQFSEDDIENYKSLLREAKLHEIQRHHVILCTCSAALNPLITKTMDFKQILIDECAMASEPEALIPLVSYKPKKIVLLGDHKQIQPIVGCARVKSLGMQQSLFERYMDLAIMLDTQYRMHEGICGFPSEEFYGGKLKTGAKREPCSLVNKSKVVTPILFSHVHGEEERLIISTAQGNENSVVNKKEAEHAVRVAGLLIKKSKVRPESIAILTPYNAQVSEINKSLNMKGIQNVSVCTVVKSQGSEWPYVILSTVRSSPKQQIKPNPSKYWLGQRLGFLTNPNQLNVAITRAQNGLCILGNRDLLMCNDLWGRLLDHYEEKNCIIDRAEQIQVVKR